MSKKLTIDFSQNAARVPASMKQRVMVGETIESVEIGSLTANPLNADVFKRESEEYFTNLTEDIRKRGIVVPLLAKRDGTLLAGHNRLEIAKLLGLKYVPVQYVQEQLSSEAEREFLIKDNLFRRQFSGSEWIEIYRRLVPNYDSIIQRDGRGGDRKSEQGTKGNAKTTEKKIKKDTVLFDFETATQDDLIQYLHKETGASVAAIQKRIQRDKQSKKSENRKTESGKSLQGIKKSSEPIEQESSNDAAVFDTKSLKDLERSLRRIESANEATRKEALKKMRAFVKKIS
jgi:ParB-like chromosome segregation protein Spo0J